MALFNKQLSIKDLLNIDPGRIDRSNDLKVKLDDVYNIIREETWLGKLTRFFKGKSSPIFYKILKYKVKSNSGNEYTTLLKVSPSFDTQKFQYNKVQLFCSCSDFKYRAAYELNKHDNLYKTKVTEDHLGIALKIAPTHVVTTPICKHLYATINYFNSHLSETGLIINK